MVPPIPEWTLALALFNVLLATKFAAIFCEIFVVLAINAGASMRALPNLLMPSQPRTSPSDVVPAEAETAPSLWLSMMVLALLPLPRSSPVPPVPPVQPTPLALPLLPATLLLLPLVVVAPVAPVALAVLQKPTLEPTLEPTVEPTLESPQLATALVAVVTAEAPGFPLIKLWTSRVAKFVAPSTICTTVVSPTSVASSMWPVPTPFSLLSDPLRSAALSP